MDKIKLLAALFFIVAFASNLRAQKYANMAEHSTNVVLRGISDVRKSVFEQNTKIFLDNINKAYREKKQPEIPSSISNVKINETIGNLWAVSTFLSVRTDVIENLLSTSQGNYEIRNLQIVLEDADSTYQQQDGVLIFDANGKIIDFKIALGFHSISTIIKNNKSVTDLRRRQMIISFVEDFRTAYNLKDIDFLEKVFSDKAVIISGKVLHKTLEGEIKPIVEYKRQTKAEYLSTLKTIFNKVKMISINFDSISVVQHPTNPDLYGITLTQTWNTKSAGGSYHDVGYVFLVIDYSKEENPKIWVRTWQDKNYIAEDHGVFSFNHFNIK